MTTPTFSRPPCFPRAWKRRNVQPAEFIDLATSARDALPDFRRKKVEASQEYGVRIGEDFHPADMPL